MLLPTQIAGFWIWIIHSTNGIQVKRLYLANSAKREGKHNFLMLHVNVKTIYNVQDRDIHSIFTLLCKMQKYRSSTCVFGISGWTVLLVSLLYGIMVNC